MCSMLASLQRYRLLCAEQKEEKAAQCSMAGAAGGGSKGSAASGAPAGAVAARQLAHCHWGI